MNYVEEYELRKNNCKYCKKKYILDESDHDLDNQENCFVDELSLEEFVSNKIAIEAEEQFKNSPYGKQLQTQSKIHLYNYYASKHTYNVELDKYVDQQIRIRLKEHLQNSV